MMRSPFLTGAYRVMKKIIQDGLNFTTVQLLYILNIEDY